MNNMEREIALSGAKNFREFGGYPTRDGRTVVRGKLFRAGMLSGLVDDDLIAIELLGIRTLCDLRRGKERDASPSRWCNNGEVNSLHLPLFLDDTPGNTGTLLADARRFNSADASRELMKASYRRMVTDSHALAQMRRIFGLITKHENLPLLIHCSGGKDRTGVCCALILTLLNVDELLIMEDYMRSLQLFTRRMSQADRQSSQVVEITNRPPIDEVLMPIYTVDPTYLQSAFSAIYERHATTANFFERALHLDAAQIRAIRANLIE